ncbi:MAG: ABC transporter ATP-binding protein [Eubacteriales bacterium]|nr:ABC transporter ATP-binding protein [Eubacteriales bacterium]MDD4475072.1 ABC transporter ATP-binding protein [Eubacteriales bacterium]
MIKLLKYLKSYLKECILAPLFKMLEASFELFVPFVVAAIIDNGIKNADKAYIIQMCVVLVILGIVGFASTITAQYYSAKAAVGFTKKLKHIMFSHLQSFSFSKIDNIGTDTMITRMTSDMNQVQTGVNLTLRLLLRSPFIVFGAMIMAFSIDFQAALVFAVVIPLLFAVVFAVMLLSIPMYKKVQSKLDEVLGKTRENLTGVRVIRAFGMEETEKEEFDAKNSALTKMQKRVGAISTLMNPLTFVIINLGIVFLINSGAIRVDGGSLTQGQVVALYNYMSQILVELIKFANLIITVTKAVASGNRINAVLEIPGGEEGSENKAIINLDNSVEFKNVNLRYGDDSEDSLKGISFKAESGEVVGIIGGTGSGKSSLVNMIPAFYTARMGEVKVGGTNVSDISVDKLREKIGIVPQKATLFKGTIRENLLWGKNDADDKEIEEALIAAQATDVVRSKDYGLDSIVEQKGRNYSGGQKQRLTIARALVKKPGILILDDSSSALDYATDAALRKAITALDYKPTVFIVSQRTSAIKHADKIIVLDNGEMVGIGKHDDLLESCAVYREIYDSQYRKEARA